MQFTHVLDILEFRIEKKKKNRENCFENIVSDLWQKKVDVSTKML